MKKLGRLEQVPLREAWKNEASEFTPWLAQDENLAALAEAIGLGELELEAVEHWVGDFKLDILCMDGADHVIIENQLEKTNHSHLGQILTYAAGVGAKKVVWIAESFRAEHIKALDFLNQNTTDDLNFFAVEIKLFRIGESALAPKFEVVAKPNEWARSVKEHARDLADNSPTKQLYLRLWTALFDALRERAPNLRPQRPRPQHWLNNSIGRAGFVLNPTVSSQKDRLGIEVYISHKESKRMFSALAAQRAEIESQLNLELDWQELPDAHACRIAFWREGCPIETESRWPEYIDWFVEHLVRFDQVFRTRIRELA